MREFQNTGNAGYANNRMLDSVFNSAIGFCFSIAPCFSSSHQPFPSKGPRLYQFSDSAAYPHIRKPSSLSSSSSSNSYQQRHELGERAFNQEGKK